jgi:hypothetical protein
MHLIVIDGVPGTGKSVIAQRLALHWEAAGSRARWFHEREAEHPVFHFSHLHDLLAHGPDRLEHTLLTGWRALLHPPALDVLVLDGTLLNLSVGLMVAMETPLERMRQVVGTIADLLQPFAPTLVQLTYPSVEEQLRAVGERRGSQWAFAMHSLLAHTPFGIAHRPGADAHDKAHALLCAFYARQTDMIASLLDLWPGTRTTRVVGDGAWARLQQQVMADVGAPTFHPVIPPAATLLRCAGHYRGRSTGRELTVTTDGMALFLLHTDGVADRLVHTTRAAYQLVEGLPAAITFDDDACFRMDTTLRNDRVTNDTFVRTAAS